MNSSKNIFSFFLSIIFFISIYEWFNLTKNLDIIKIIGTILISFSIYSAYLLRDEQGVYVFSFIILISIFTDLGGYFFGKTFKGPKLTKISPNKTFASNCIVISIMPKKMTIEFGKFFESI